MKIKKGKVGAAQSATGAAERATATSPSACQRERIMVRVGQLKAAPWNPRKSVTPESVADLTASIKTLGLIQPLVAMEGEGGELTLIAGHRRLVAAKAAGLETVPCDVLRGIDEATARRMTFVENLQRKDADPLLESELVSKLVADGMTQVEISAEISRNRKWVMRRLNLAKLSGSWRKRVGGGEAITVDCLEHIAAFPDKVQERCKRAHEWAHESPLTWGDVKSEFSREVCDLDEAEFATGQCAECAKRTGANPDLFDFYTSPKNKLGHCLDRGCFAKRTAAQVAKSEKVAAANGAPVVKGRPPAGAKDALEYSKRKGLTTLYVWEDWDGTKHAAWSVASKEEPKGGGDGLAARRTEEEKERRAAKKRRNKAIRHLAQVCAENDALGNRLAALGAMSCSGAFLVQHLFRTSWASWKVVGGEMGLEEAAYSAARLVLDGRGGEMFAPLGYYRAMADEVIKGLEPAICEGYRAESNARTILGLFPSFRGMLSAEELAAIGERAPKVLDWVGEAHGEGDVGDENDITEEEADDGNAEG